MKKAAAAEKSEKKAALHSTDCLYGAALDKKYAGKSLRDLAKAWKRRFMRNQNDLPGYVWAAGSQQVTESARAHSYYSG